MVRSHGHLLVPFGLLKQLKVGTFLQLMSVKKCPSSQDDSNSRPLNFDSTSLSHLTTAADLSAIEFWMSQN